MGAAQRALAAQAVAALIAVATGCHTPPEPRPTSLDWLRPLPPIAPGGVGAPVAPRETARPDASGGPAENALPPPDALDAAPAWVPLPVVTPAKAEVPSPLPTPLPVPLPVVEPAVEWKPVGAAEPLKPPVVVPEREE